MYVSPFRENASFCYLFAVGCVPSFVEDSTSFALFVDHRLIFDHQEVVSMGINADSFDKARLAVASDCRRISAWAFASLDGSSVGCSSSAFLSYLLE
jgi:hypothetical protein